MNQNDIEKYSIEYYKCKKNLLYFAYNYVYIPEIGGRLKFSKRIANKKIIRFLRSLIRFHKVNLLASRQLGKSTAAAIALLWAAIFYPGMNINVLTIKQSYAIKFLKIIRFMHEQLPDWMILLSNGDFISGSLTKTFLDFKNKSIITTFYTSGSSDPETVARSLTSAVLYIDECAFIRHMRAAYGAAQQTLSKARDQAIKYGYPYFIAITSTPNGTVGAGEFYHSLWVNGINSDDIFTSKTNEFNANETLMPNVNEIISDPNRNSFINIKYHWLEDPTKDKNWYNLQLKDLNFDYRRINQEVDIVFVGSRECIFSDDFLSELKEKPSIEIIEQNKNKLKLFDELCPDNFYLIGIDSAKSLVGDYCAIEIFNFSDFRQVGEFFDRIGSILKYVEFIKFIITELLKKNINNLILCIENNSIGGDVIELLLDDNVIDYSKYIFLGNEKKFEYGIGTNVKTKPLMISYFYEYINTNPKLIKSNDLINQLHVLHRNSNGTVSAMSGYHDDLVMASSFCAYVRKLTMFDVLPQINTEPQHEKNNDFIDVDFVVDPKQQNDTLKPMRLEYDNDFLQNIKSVDNPFYSDDSVFINY